MPPVQLASSLVSNVVTPEESYRETARYGVAIGAAGVASIGVGAWLWWRGSRSAPTVAVGRSSAMIGWAGSF